MLNDIINIDLHIHSIESEYKEEKGYLNNSTIDNIDVLLKKLNENNINLFAITDHNRFDKNLYDKIKTLIGKELYKNILNVLPGIEFDVQIDEGKKACHIICIFDDSKPEKLSNINTVLNKKKLTRPTEYYTKDEFENILKKINLSTLLIAHQHKHFDNASGGKRSLSNSVDNIYEFIETGYINALEYQRPSVQGMIINSLKKVNKNVASIIGSDCHQWEYYPQKDNKTGFKGYVSKIKALPTFKGLVFSFTSMDTRFNRLKNTNVNYIDKIKIKDREYPLSNGINAIIGDNGSGKTMLMDILTGSKLKNEYKAIKKLNEIEVIELGTPSKEYIKQNQIIDDVRKGKLFSASHENKYKDITTKQTFKTRVNNYAIKLIKAINKNIEIEELKNNLENIIFAPASELYEIVIPNIKNDLSIVENEFEEHAESLQIIYETLLDEYNDNKKFYNKNKGLNAIITQLKKLIIDYTKKSDKINREILIKNSIISRCEVFNSNMSSNETDKEKEFKEYKKNKQKFIKAFATLIKLQNKDIIFPEFPKPIKGFSKKINNGYSFNKVTGYNEVYEKDNFFIELFTKGYNEEKVKKINSKEELVLALNGISKYEDINNWYKKVDNFIDECSFEETYIEKVSTKQSMGKTPGEIAIVFYDFKLKHNDEEKNVILIDQPEDDISNKIISDELTKYINENRDKKQIIIVTHNPVLVVNLDVDNVILLNKDYKNNLDVKNGCLEFVCKSYAMINEVANNMDGGIEIVEKRFRLYENKNKS